MKYTKEILQDAVSKSYSIYGVMRYLGIRETGGSHSHIKRKIEEYNIDKSHFTGQGWTKGKKALSRKTWQQVLIKSNTNRRECAIRLRRSLIEFGRPYVCRKCGCDGIWQGEKITLEVNHINNDWTDHRPENIEFLCPNCHSQYPHPRHTGSTGLVSIKSKKTKIVNKIRIDKKCKCGKSICIDSQTCLDCYDRSLVPHKTKIVWPTNEELEKLLLEMPASKLATKLGVTDKAIEKRCKKFGIKKPSRGYWEKKYHASVC